MSDHGTGNDPINELSRFGEGFTTGTGGDMPLSAAAVRRRGDQIRRRRNALVAGASALAVAAIAVPILAISGGTPKADDTNDIADDGKGSLTVANLITDDDTVYSDGADWFRTNVGEGDGQDVFNPCAQQSLTGTGATSVVRADFELRNTDDPTAAITGDYFIQVVGDYDDAAAATAAYDRISAWVETCEQRAADITEYRFLAARDVPVNGAAAQILDSHYGPVPKEIDEFGDSAHIMETGLLRQGDKLVVLTSVIIGQDYNFLDGTPVEQMLPKAAARLGNADGDTTTPPAETGEDATSGTVNPAIPADFPLTSRWPDASQAEDGNGLVGPARDLDPLAFTACDTTLPDAPHADRLLARWENVEDYRTRQVTTYDTADQAVAAVAGIRALYEACPEGEKRDDGFTPNWEVRDLTLGGESFAVLGWDELDGAATTFGDTTLVVRVGSSVLVVAHAGHSGNPQGNEQGVIDQMSSESADVIAALCVYTEAGC